MDFKLSEHLKYSKMWGQPWYREHSPAVDAFDYIARLPMEPGDTVLDVGTGTGRVLAMLHRQFDVFPVGMDFVDAIETNYPFIEHCLWESMTIARFDWLTCVDVLEHIPPVHVDATLSNISQWAPSGYLQIALFPTKKEGMDLHLTVQSKGWWSEAIAEHGMTTEDVGSDERHARFIYS